MKNKGILFIIIILVLVSCQGPGKKELKFNLEVGKTYKFNQESKQDITQTINGTNQNMQTSISGSMSFHVKEKDSNNFIIDVIYDKMAFTMTTPYMQMSFDSEKPLQQGDILGLVFSKLIGKTFTMTLSPYGKVIKVEGSEKLFTSILNKMELPNQSARPKLEEMLKNVAGEKSFKGNMEMVTYIFPTMAVNVGETWQNEVNLAAAMPATMKNEWKLKEIKGEVATIEGKSTILSKDQESFMPINGMPTKYNITGTQNATIKIDEKTGWVIDANIVSSISGSVVIDKNPQAPQGMEIPLKFETTTVYTNLE